MVASTARRLVRPGPARRAAVLLVAIVIAGLVAATTLAVSPRALADALLAGDAGWLMVSAGLYGLAHLLSGLLWHRSLVAAEVAGVSRGAAMRAHWLARGASELLPAQLGEAVRIAAVRAGSRGTRNVWRIAGSVAAYKTVDGLSSVLVAAAVLGMLAAAPLGGSAPGVLALAALALIGVAILSRHRPRRLVGRLPQRARWAAGELARGGRVLISGRHVPFVAVLQTLVLTTRILSVAALLAAYDAPLAAAPAAFSLMIVAGLLPITPGGAGVREVALVPVLVTSFGLGVDTALAVSLASQACALGVSLTGAGIAALASAPRTVSVSPAPPAELAVPLRVRPAA